MKIEYKVVVQVNAPHTSQEVKKLEHKIETASYEEAELILRNIKAVARNKGRLP